MNLTAQDSSAPPTYEANVHSGGRPLAAGGSLSPSDLADLLGAFNEASFKLQQSHEVLQAEVVRLKRELKNANEALERSRRLAALGEMAAGIAHEVRNPLGSIRLYANMLINDLEDRQAERDLARKIAKAVSGLDAVVGDVLAFSREMRVNLDEHDPRELLSAAVEEVLVGGKNAAHPTLRVLRLDQARYGDECEMGRAVVEGPGVEGIEEVVPSVRCDATLIHRALVNIVRNAVEAIAESSAGGLGECAGSAAIVLDAQRRRTVDAAGQTRDWIVLSIRDTGGGIPEDAMGRIFNPFFTTRAVGTGLGLSIVHRIMDAHAGRIAVANVDSQRLSYRGGELELGCGAQIELFLPVITDADLINVSSAAYFPEDS